MSRSFHREAARDASGAIGGFVYQFDHSVLRWLQLGPNEEMELEGGEDIDLVAKAALADDHDAGRVLIDLKGVARRVTLNSPSAIAAVAHLAGHRHRNPEQRISLIYVTTAQMGRERNRAQRDAALNLWNQARAAGALSAEDASGLSQLLRNARRPKQCVSDQDWTALHDLLDTQGGLESLVMGLEWVTGAPTSAQVRDQAVALLAAHEGITSDEHARQAQCLLFVELLRGVAEGRKRFGRADLERCLTASHSDVEGLTTAVAMRAHVDELEARFADVSRRVSVLEALAEGLLHDIDLGGLQSESRAAARTAGAEILGKLAALLKERPHETVPPQVDPPPLGPGTIPRATAEKVLTNLLERHAWVHVFGSIRAGKTTLVRRCVEGRRPVTWLRCRDLGGPGAQALLRAASGTDGSEPMSAITSMIGRDGVLVLDDIPDLSDARELGHTIESITALIGHAAQVVTTGVRRLASRPGLAQLPVHGSPATRCARCSRCTRRRPR